MATPLQGQNNPASVPELFVLTPLSPRSRLASDKQTQIDALYTYMVVRESNVLGTSRRKPDYDLLRGNYYAYMLHREEVRVSVDQGNRVTLPTPANDFPQNPGFPSTDPRWICHLPSLMPPGTVSLLPTVLAPLGQPIEPKLGARLKFSDGEFRGTFPCGRPVAQTTFKHSRFNGYLAQEMAWSINVDQTVSFLCDSFDGAGSTQIDLAPVLGRAIDVFFVSAPLITMEDIATHFANPCSMRNDHHNGAQYDYEFEVLWDLFTFPSGAGMPVPVILPQQGTRVDCIPGGA
ncbi:MAG TPA: hypothetical protein VGF48_07135 [Thermoanaerobaculia bacterium]